MKHAPLIVVSTMTEHKGAEFRDRSTSLSFWYTRAIARAGGVPLLAPNFPEQKNLAREMVARADGLMLTGGDDLQPDLYNPALPRHIKAKAGGVDPARDLFEFQLIEQALQQCKPMLAICRGPQVLNVALGGGLVTDIPIERPPSREPRPPRQGAQIGALGATGEGFIDAKSFPARHAAHQQRPSPSCRRPRADAPRHSANQRWHHRSD